MPPRKQTKMNHQNRWPLLVTAPKRLPHPQFFRPGAHNYEPRQTKTRTQMGEASRRESREFVLATKADRQGAIVKMKSRLSLRLASGTHQDRLASGYHQKKRADPNNNALRAKHYEAGSAQQRGEVICQSSMKKSVSPSKATLSEKFPHRGKNYFSGAKGASSDGSSLRGLPTALPTGRWVMASESNGSRSWRSSPTSSLAGSSHCS